MNPKTYRIKPLVWEGSKSGSFFVSKPKLGEFNTGFMYWILKTPHGWVWTVYGMAGETRASDFKSAQAACQQDYEQRLAQALEEVVL